MSESRTGRMGTNQPGNMAISDRHLDKIKEGVQEEQKAQRPISNRIIKQASKVRLIEPTQSQRSTPMSSSTQSTNLSLEPKPQRLKESKK